MKKTILAMILAAVAVTSAGSLQAAQALPRDNTDRSLSSPAPQTRSRDLYCEAVGSGLWDCEEKVCGDWHQLQSSCWIIIYRRDDNPYP